MSRWGVWRADYGLEVLAADKWELRKDLTGVMFQASTAHEPPYVDSRDIDPDILDSYDLPQGYRVLPFSHR